MADANALHVLWVCHKAQIHVDLAAVVPSTGLVLARGPKAALQQLVAEHLPAGANGAQRLAFVAHCASLIGQFRASDPVVYGPGKWDKETQV